ncbi:MAG TPA: hypothetical protein VKA75_14735 [Reyranella sp.]|nr:hypothetical protein [Reyranella sp.]
MIFWERHVSGLRADRSTTYCDDGAIARLRRAAAVTQLQIRDENNNPMRQGEAGEIVANGEGQISTRRASASSKAG